MTAPRLEIVIDELVVRGLSPTAARVAAAALETRLAALAEAPNAAIPARAEAFRRLPPVEAASPAEVGHAVARSVWGALSPGGTR